jgi:hypothetical protein
VVVCAVRSPDVVEILELEFDQHVDAVEHGDLVGRAVQRTFRARAVVPLNVDDQRVVQLAHVLDRLDHPADLMIRVGHVGREYVHLAEEHLLLVRSELVPLLQQVLGPGGEPGVLRDHTELFLVGEDLFAQGVPALVEEMHVADLLYPFRRCVVRCMGAAGHVIDEERPIWYKGVDPLHVRNGLVRHGGREVKAWIAQERIDVRRVAGQVRRLPLVGVTAHESVEILEAHADWPLVEGAVLACLKGRRVVVLAEPGGAVAVVLQNLADRRLVLLDEAVLSREAGSLLRDHAEPHRVVVAAGDEGGTRRRTECRGMEIGVAQPCPGDAVKLRASGSRRRTCWERRSRHHRS